MRDCSHPIPVLRSLASLVLLVAFTLVGFGWRTLLQVRRHGDTGWRFSRSGPDRVVGSLFALSVLLLGAAPLAALVAGEPWAPGGIPALTDGAGGGVVGWVGVAFVVAGGMLTVVAQVQMGASWRIGVQAGERTALVTGGLFAHVRNPIFTGMAVVAVGSVLLTPNAVALVGTTLTLVTLQVQVRLVEEPHLLAVHGEIYRRWTTTAGRFLPGLGRGI